MELGKGYSTRSLKNMRNFYLFQKGQPLDAQLAWSHYVILLSLKDNNQINYYKQQVISRNLSKRELQNIMKNKEYERLPDKTKYKLIVQEDIEVQDFIKNPIIIRDNYSYDDISEKVLKQLVLEDIDNFLRELGEGFSYICNEYKIKLGNRYNYLDLLLFNIQYNCYVVIELKITELKKEHIGQIQTYMNYIDKNIRTFNQDKR